MSTTHDYTLRVWGHDYSILDVKDEGRKLKMSGWGVGIRTNDYIVIPNKEATNGETRYQIDSIRYCSDPPDMWFADATWAPRQKAAA